MRKNLSLYFLVVISFFASCRKYDDVFNESPDERINEVLAQYQQTLTDAPYGWKGWVYPSGLPGTAIGFYFKFDTANRVNMLSDFDTASAINFRQSSYRLKALQQPCLLFDTYSYIHTLCDPDGSVNGGDYGKGLYSDFEFAIDGIYGDTIKLTGRLNGSKAVFVKATSKEAQDYYDKKRNWEFDNFSRFLTYFKQLTVGQGTYDVYTNKLTRQIKFVWPDAGGVKSFTTLYLYTPVGISFVTPFNDGKQTISSLDNIRWDAGAQQITFKAGTQDGKITAYIKPLVVDSTAAQRWWSSAAASRVYWVTLTGFHIDGVDDALKLNSIPGFRFMSYFPNYAQGYDYSATVAGDDYGPAIKPTFGVNGIVKFRVDGTFGQVPAEAATVMNALITKYQESTGYYLVQTSERSYDMVNVKDARSWITWFN
ncbi:DUF4302 domain-containing protein [Chitinophaga tropicalis]|uniref:DUF4302 domain-containing protein n=1 Tax=Chitinophaga tropicalis TaxID=2683588 RepID=A0A7K1U6G1_9BACT|nr:DUF4302 domain-containing protein [Chitinophaga tropicalis]MVT09951.1 DUF4302 domain-containing protein [Chitinophaga tropicalis]